MSETHPEEWRKAWLQGRTVRRLGRDIEWCHYGRRSIERVAWFIGYAQRPPTALSDCWRALREQTKTLDLRALRQIRMAA